MRPLGRRVHLAETLQLHPEIYLTKGRVTDVYYQLQLGYLLGLRVLL